MLDMHKVVGILSLSCALALAACGGGGPISGPDGSTGGRGGATGGQGGSGGRGGSTGADASTTLPCAALGACECLAAAGRCATQTEACWCPGECFPGGIVDCICGGGRFLACRDTAAVASCTTGLTAVQTKCAGQAFVQYIGGLCSSAGDPTCVAGCLANLAATGSCAEIDCGFCPVCDCVGPAPPSPFAACLATCAPP